MTDSALDIATEAARGELSAIHGPVLRTAMGDVLDALAEAGYSVDLLSELVAAEERTYQHGKRMGSREQRARIRAEIKPHILKLQLVLETCWTEDNEPSETAPEVAADVLAIIAEDDSDE